MAKYFFLKQKNLLIQGLCLLIWGSIGMHGIEITRAEDSLSINSPLNEIQQSSTPPNKATPKIAGDLPVVTVQAEHTALLSDGMLEEMLLNKAYQRDSTLQKLTRKLGHVTTVLPFLTGTMIGSTALSQNILALRLIDQKKPTVSSRKAIPTLGVVGQSTLLGSLTIVAMLRLHYNRQIHKRKQVLQAQVASVLNALEAGEDPNQIQKELNRLVGENASREFMGFWKLLYPVP